MGFGLDAIRAQIKPSQSCEDPRDLRDVQVYLGGCHEQRLCLSELV
jgi:hypothetical protein